MDMIVTSECEKCIHSVLDESDKSKVKIYCKVKDKVYYWGQCIPCSKISVFMYRKTICINCIIRIAKHSAIFKTIISQPIFCDFPFKIMTV